MNLILLRHAKAMEREEWKKKSADDSKRPLTQEGIDKFKLSLNGLNKILPKFDSILSSEFNRCRETAELFSQAFKQTFVIDSLLNHGGSPFLIWKKLQGFEGQTVVLIGHEPELSQLASFILDKPADHFYLKKGGALLIENVFHRPHLKWHYSNRFFRELNKK
jgi:phosphohistidine phosphatase